MGRITEGKVTFWFRVQVVIEVVNVIMNCENVGYFVTEICMCDGK